MGDRSVVTRQRKVAVVEPPTYPPVTWGVSDRVYAADTIHGTNRGIIVGRLTPDGKIERAS